MILISVRPQRERTTIGDERESVLRDMKKTMSLEKLHAHVIFGSQRIKWSPERLNIILTRRKAVKSLNAKCVSLSAVCK